MVINQITYNTPLDRNKKNVLKIPFWNNSKTTMQKNKLDVDEGRDGG